jgi:hypothetical protein
MLELNTMRTASDFEYSPLAVSSANQITALVNVTVDGRPSMLPKSVTPATAIAPCP